MEDPRIAGDAFFNSRPRIIRRLRRHWTLAGLRAIAAARADDTATAHQSLLIALRLTRASLSDPFLISELVACNEATHSCNAVWEICDAHAGSAEDFLRLQEELAKLNFTASLLQCFRGETASGVSGALLWLKRHYDSEGCLPVLQNMDAESSFPGFLSSAAPQSRPWRPLGHECRHLDGQHGVSLISSNLCATRGLNGSLTAGDAMDEILADEIPRYRLDKVFVKMARLDHPAFSRLAARVPIPRASSTRPLPPAPWSAGSSNIISILSRLPCSDHPFPQTLSLANPWATARRLTANMLFGTRASMAWTTVGKLAARSRRSRNPTKFSKREYKGDWVWSYQPN